jgi:hypothetical protein
MGDRPPGWVGRLRFGARFRGAFAAPRRLIRDAGIRAANQSPAAGAWLANAGLFTF